MRKVSIGPRSILGPCLPAFRHSHPVSLAPQQVLPLSYIVLSRSIVSNSLWSHGWQPSRCLCPWGFLWQEHWSGLPFPPAGNLPNSGIRSVSPSLGNYLLLSHGYCISIKWALGTSLVAQWLRISLAMQGTQVRSLVRELISHMSESS